MEMDRRAERRPREERNGGRPGISVRENVTAGHPQRVYHEATMLRMQERFHEGSVVDPGGSEDIDVRTRKHELRL